jgi:hypothetical protein
MQQACELHRRRFAPARARSLLSGAMRCSALLGLLCRLGATRCRGWCACYAWSFPLSS